MILFHVEEMDPKDKVQVCVQSIPTASKREFDDCMMMICGWNSYPNRGLLQDSRYEVKYPDGFMTAMYANMLAMILSYVDIKRRSNIEIREIVDHREMGMLWKQMASSMLNRRQMATANDPDEWALWCWV
jgi:hypothetical protein